MTISTAVGSDVVLPGQTLNLSTLFTVTAGSNDPTYIDVTMFDRNEYPGAHAPNPGYFHDSGLQLTDFNKLEPGFLGATPTDVYDTGIIFTYQASSGRYYNSTYGYFDTLQFEASTSQYENAYLSIFYTNSASTLSAVVASPTDYFLDPINLAEYVAQTGGGGYIGTIDVISRSDISSGAFVQATPNGVSAVAQTFVGKIWNIEGCWVLASNIAAEAGSSLPPTTASYATTPLSGVQPFVPLASGEWIIAYSGPQTANPSIAAGEALVRPGDVITLVTPSSAHITTVVSGYGTQAQVIDNLQTGTNYVDPSDIIIVGPHPLSQELSTAIPADLVIYRLDTPTITINEPTTSIAATGALSLAPMFTATDAGGAGSLPIVNYAFYDTGTGSGASDTFSVGGVSETAHSAAAAIIVGTSALPTLSLQTTGTASGTDTVYVDGYNGEYWGDWVALTFSISASSTIVTNATGSQTTFIAPFANSTIEGSGYDILDLLQNPIATASSAYAMTSNGDGTFNLTTKGSSDHVVGVMQVEFSNETVTFAKNGSENEYIALLYQGALGRPPDAAGLAGWEQIAGALPASTQAMGVYGLSDVSGNYNASLSIAAGFTNSPEFIAKYGSLTNQQFVTNLYANILDRAPDPTGLSGWLSQLSSGATREHVLVGFADSQESISNATTGYTGQSGAHAAWLFLV